MPQPRILIIKTGTALTDACARFGDFEDWFMDGIGPEFEYDCVAVFRGEALPPPDRAEDFAGIVISGSAAMVSHRNEWSENTAAWLKDTHPLGIPTLGICYGHQLLAHALGGLIGPNPHGRRMGTLPVEIDAQDDPLMDAFTGVQYFQTTHLETVLEPPPGAVVLGVSPADPYHVLGFGPAVWGVQFHPEFDGAIMTCYIRFRRPLLEAEGYDPDGMLATVRPAPAGAALMARFAGLVRENAGSAAGLRRDRATTAS